MADLEVMETEQFVVMEAMVGSHLVWAWCLVGPGPGFKAVTYTEPDGVSIPDFDELGGMGPTRLTTHLFTVVVPAQDG